ncbi:MAG: hypothetical protein H7829_12275 [Magnetococcus sp. THC-1_WYH]
MLANRWIETDCDRQLWVACGRCAGKIGGMLVEENGMGNRGVADFNHTAWGDRGQRGGETVIEGA